ncbi:PREDICTED: conserved oligomeric Golgi complex subunit 5-like [Priapulus caudatus]|uniref:Conserved oligomeric Golgi complex subunit 5 n=1 Tax=Priapulus caudatus TaxID=37621 RepID=A0ABM1DV73_PRICU|nr:PREDICTED: conserved oligomeric Golgi complex subunit 5-like [Priapulus caudatus]
METDLWHQIQTDEVFNEFMKDDFDVRSHATRVIQSLAIAEQLGKLASGISLLDKELHSQVAAHHKDLLSQATGIESLEGVLEMMNTRIQSLQSSVERIRGKVVDPYKKIASRTVQLRRLQATCDLLRVIIRVLYLSRKLKSQLEGGTREITKAALSLSELDYLTKDVDLSGVDVIEKDQKFIKQARRDVDSQAQRLLKQGMESQNQTQVATALQVFYNLGCLKDTVDKVVGCCREGLHENVKTALDIRVIQQSQPPPDRGKGGPGRAAMPTPGNTAAYRATLWTNMAKLMDNIYSTCSQVEHLQKVLEKKRDPVTHVCFVDELLKDGSITIVQSFWEAVTQILTEEFSKAANDSSFIKQAFDGEYPKLLRLYNDLWKRLQQFTAKLTISASLDGLEATGNSALSSDYSPEKAMRHSLLAFENAYLSRSLSRLFDPINLAFSSGPYSSPTNDEVDGIVKTVASELNVANVDTSLSIMIGKNVAKTIKLFTVKCEQLLLMDSEATQVIGPATESQRQNAGVVNTLYRFHKAINKVLSGLSGFPPPAISYMQESLEDVVELMQAALQPLLMAVSDTTGAIVLTLHQEDFSQVQPIACQCIEQFVKQASLVRPLGEGGKMRLAADFAQMEAAISPLCYRISDLGKSYRLLRSFRPFLFQTPEHIAASSSLGEAVSYSLALNFLFARAPKELKAPHVRAGWSITDYSRWLDKHPHDKDRLTLIKGAMESYVQSVKSRQGKEFASVYPVMVELLNKGLQQT